MLSILVAILLVIVGPLWFLILRRTAQTYGRNGRKLPPGPRPLPIIGSLHMLTTLPHRGLRDLAQKYGPIMSLWLGQVPAVVISSPEAAELFLKTHDIAFASRPIIQASEYLSYGSKGMVFTEYGPYWRNLRKLCTLQLMSRSKIESFAALRRDEVGALVERLKEAAAAAGEVVDVSAKVRELIEDITYKMILGRNKDEKYDLKKIIGDSTNLVGAFNLADYVPYLGPLDLQMKSFHASLLFSATILYCYSFFFELKSFYLL
ncbi:hypothetical protein TIFTF001_043372 [Ficus carica]|uniref:Cytochrome P450 n=1 Tax=Ficus carica TaxID=3494 RepID=A0AA88CL25_FICCA|nr:hypothetical protein TIFTF001_043372 [Ficus carica]